VELDLAALDELKKHPKFSAPGSGSAAPTAVFSFGCNPGLVSHTVQHGLWAATGIADVAKAAEAFKLRSAIFTGAYWC